MSLEHFWIEIKTNFWKNLASTQKSLPKFTKSLCGFNQFKPGGLNWVGFYPANPGSLAITETSTPDLDPTTKAVHYIWELKDNYVPYNTKWSIFSKANTFNPVTKKCRLCLKEVYYILYKPETASIKTQDLKYLDGASTGNSEA